MFSLQDIVGQQKGNDAVSQISQMLGADQTTTNSAIQMALPIKHRLIFDCATNLFT